MEALREMINKQLEQISTEICDHYCKYPYEYDEEKEGVQLSESEICKNCPLTRL